MFLADGMLALNKVPGDQLRLDLKLATAWLIACCRSRNGSALAAEAKIVDIRICCSLHHQATGCKIPLAIQMAATGLSDDSHELITSSIPGTYLTPIKQL